MKHIYYRNDFAVEVELFNLEGMKVPPPEWKWSIEFSDSRKKYVCSLDKGNAEVMDDGSVMCYLDNHNFYCGRLSCKFKEQIPNLSYLDGFQRVIRPTDIEVELWDKPSDNDGNVSVSVIPDYVIYDAWMIAKANGYSGTQEEFYTALNELPKTIETAESVLQDTRNLADDLADKVATDYYRGEKGEKGDKGDKGDVGEKGEQGIQGIQGLQGIQGEKGEKGDKGDTGNQGPIGNTGPKGEQGIQGVQGEKGADGFSPIVSLTKQGTISTLSITDAQGEHTTEIADGAKGDDGFSPIVSLNKVDNVTTLTITDAQGTHTATVNDGESVNVVQSTGTSTTSVMSQKAVSDALSNVYTKSESDALLAEKQNLLTAGNGITIADDVISVDDKKFTVWSNPRIDEFVTTFENYGYNDDGTQKTSGSSTRSWVFKIGNYGHKKVYFSAMNAWMCDGIDDSQNMIKPTLLGKLTGNVDIGEEHIGKYIIAMLVSGYVGYGANYGRCVQFCDTKTQAELDADERMLSDMYAGNLMRYAVATSGISDTPTLEWGDGAGLRDDNKRNIFLDSVSRPNIGYECNVAKKLHYIYQGCGRLREITPLWDTSLVTTMLGAFSVCLSLERADLSHLDLSSVTDVSFMFYNCNSLHSVILQSLPAVTNCQSMFSNCTTLQSITLPSIPAVTNCSNMFYNCTSLQSITLPSIPAVTSCSNMFYYCTSLQSITLPSIPAVTNCRSMFSNCTTLQSLYIDMPNCENFAYSFYACYALHTLEIVDVRKATELVNSFQYCSSLQNVTCVEELPKCKISFGSSSKLTLDSVTNIITHLPDLSGESSKTLTLHATTKALLTEALIAEATNKNWIIA